MARHIIERIRYPSSGYSIVGWVMRPAVDGRLPVLVYNHGSRAGHGGAADLEQATLSFAKAPWPGVAKGVCAVFFPEGRGYAGSEGPTLNDCRDMSEVMAFLEGRADDAVAGADWLGAQSWADGERLAMAGCSHGAVVSLLAAQSGKFASIIAQAPGASASLPLAGLDEMRAAVQATDVPILLQHATDDLLCPFETSAALFEAGEMAGKAIRLRPYPPVPGIEGHAQFDFENRAIWAQDFDEALEATIGVRPLLAH